MNYLKHYELLIKKAKNRDIVGYIEKHHIIPKCLGGSDDIENIAKLTPEEHYIAHLLLVKIYPTNESLTYAAIKMTVATSTVKRNNKLYGWLKKKYQKICKNRIGEKNPSFGKPWFYNPITNEAKKFIKGTEPTGWILGRKNTNTKCKTCGEETTSRKAKWCDKCRILHRKCSKNGAIKNVKLKNNFTMEEKRQALINNDGNIRKALFSLGLNDSGSHYQKMKEIKFSILEFTAGIPLGYEPSER